MRDRLIALLDEAKYKALETIGSLNNGFGAWYADYLLAAGVIVPPCKVGDVVYVVDGTTDGIVEGQITNLEYNFYTSPREWITVKGRYPFFGELYEKNRIDLLVGKTVFLTREEAERALAERSEG